MKLRVSSVAPTSSAHVSATCTAAMIVRPLTRLPPMAPLELSASAPASRRRRSCQAGSTPSSRPAIAVIATATLVTVHPSAMPSARGKFGGSTDGSRPCSPRLSSRPATPPAAATSRLSIISCWTRRDVPAPIADTRLAASASARCPDFESSSSICGQAAVPSGATDALSQCETTSPASSMRRRAGWTRAARQARGVHDVEAVAVAVADGLEDDGGGGGEIALGHRDEQFTT